MTEIMDITSYILKGSTITLKIYLVTAVFAVPLGILCALGKISESKILSIILGLYTWIFRGTPLLLQLVFTYFGLGVMGIKLTPFAAAAITYILNYGAYLTEIYRGGIKSIDKGQYEAAKALGMSNIQTFVNIILPQAFKRVIPPTCNEAINLVKDTALVSVIGMGDILRNGKEIVTREFTISPLIIAAIIYLLITSVLVTLFRTLENKYSFYE